ncbi:Glycosyltransferase involved in cell wall bisynthesis [Hymenobacter gelipurpurascens]|uniref:Glycosyltransferase involved in cell wall bisynthesis n=2 Tax=Hymenobacter gelipurpurascens TaxID=89968 RepID=A0A212UH77_9BACT|nr:Glycosyltransferase involved in cell wall bisynthesis [Hymenobacter gelipurpurascens]
MPRFTSLLAEGMRRRGHQVVVWAPTARFPWVKSASSASKWLGYIDQYVLFPLQVYQRIKHCPVDTLFVFTDHALGPWVPLVAERPHAIHCHDFLAQRSALGEIPQHSTGWTGRIYQAFIRWGYKHGANFISVSLRTRRDLHRFLSRIPTCTEVVYNGFNQQFTQLIPEQARQQLTIRTGFQLLNGYLLHVGGNQWYKNREGVIAIYNAWRAKSQVSLPLLMVGAAPTHELARQHQDSDFKQDIYFVEGLADEEVRLAYSGATALLFPSLAEGFGWPIAEAMASGCPVITTEETPMTEVGGSAAFYIPLQSENEDLVHWAEVGARVVEKVVQLCPEERQETILQCLTNAHRFNTSEALDRIESIYLEILQCSESKIYAKAKALAVE